MPTNLGKKYLGYINRQFYIFIFSLFSISAFSQACPQTLDFDFKPSQPGNGINWLQFPEFDLPFKIVYGGPSRFVSTELMFKRGFTHLSNPNLIHLIPEKNRAFIQYSVAYSNPGQPWMTHKSPFNNDFSVYQRYWDTEITRIIGETNGKDRIAADIYVFDVETQLKSDDSILVLKNSSVVPQQIRNLSNQQFIEQYKRGIQDLYGKAMQYMLDKGKITAQNISSYSDAPILNTFINIQGRSWDAWKTDKSAVNYVCYDFDKNQVGGLAYNTQTFMTPSAYFYYDYPHPFAGEYLSYLLFQIEANRAWTSKDQMVFVWGKYSFNKEFVLKNIKPWMAESMAIFPFFAGAKGLWLWEDPTITENDMSNYEYFTKGLYRLSKFKNMFEGDYKLIETISAREYNETKKPIWRGVFKDNKLLVVAHNPNAKSETEEVKVLVNYGNFNKEITLKGFEVFLCQFDLSLPTGTEPNINFTDLSCFPNPTSDQIRIQLGLKSATKFRLKITDILGKSLYNEEVESKEQVFDKLINVSDFNTSEIIVSIQDDNSVISKKIIIAQ
ncbi:T9SS type A sorting domain-containing protein [Lacihabitans soyangensis]|uniref:T9SS C-terminal target domain-containing protein n=1 Tax=Lacihabitans soyangensis TaxID=869394 RepID=A0AAE3H7J9_9BACT|nr:T9SS type A sorting domain-containing protein [Lacihabitans soyangensis]MCP9764535.1 T9SS C-terminal target domain-containing protein [Lacihabitans soyangensis]